jgi:LPXTG-site transpeptidase (sortase) family protein
LSPHSLHQQILDNHSTEKPAHNKRPLHKRHVLLYASAFLVFIVGFGVSLQSVFVNHKVEQQVLAYSTRNQDGDDVPSEAQPKQDQTISYTVAPQLPRILRIPSLGVSTRILQMGVDEDNQLKSPGGIFDAGWYTGSSLPGQQGAMLIDGHVSGPTKHGVFYELKTLKQGDSIQLERGDGKQFNYEVRAVKTIAADQVDMAELLQSIDPSLPGLNLITCGGEYNPNTRSYASRTLVYSIQK